MYNSDGLPSTVALVFYVFLFVMAVVWFFLPFAIFGIKDRLDKLLAKVDANTRAVESLARAIELQKKP